MQNLWGSLSMGQRLALGGVLLAVFAGILLVAQWAGRPPYGVLFSNLESQDAGAVTGKLRDQKIDYRLTDGGRTIQVPQDKVYDLRLSLATEGLPRGGSAGFELFDKPNFTATDFTQHLNYRRALEGELERTIRELDGVGEARVHVAMPEKQLFLEKEEPVTASIVLHVRPGRQISERQVGGIVHLVSSAVEGLKPDNVTVHDAQGELLSGGSGGPAPQLTGSQVELQMAFERRLEAKLQRLGDQVLGPGNSAVRVSAELNWDRMETTSETYRPSGTNRGNLPTEEEQSQEAYASRFITPTPARGVPGATANLRPLAVTSSNENPGQYTNTRTQRKFAVSKVVEHRTAAPGKVKRLSIAVLIDQSVRAAQREALKNAFAAAAGLDLEPVSQGGRADRIELLPMKFDRTAVTAATQAAETQAKRGFQAELIRNIAAVVIVLIVLVASVLVGRRLMAPQPQGLDALIDEPATRQIPAAGAGTYTASGAAAPVRESAASAERVRRLAADRPEELARQLQTWMAE
jgi:flagellar M-ring protein FliF